MRDTLKDDVLVERGRKLKDLRDKADLTQTEFAEKIGATRSLVNMWEAGERPVKLNYLERIADFFGCTVDYLLCRSNVYSPNPDIQAACAYTGLSEDAIDRIQMLFRLESERNFPVMAPLESIIKSESILKILYGLHDLSDVIGQAESLKANSVRYKDEYARACHLVRDRIEVDLYRLSKYSDEMVDEISGAENVIESLTEIIRDN